MGNRCSLVLWMVIALLVVWVCDDEDEGDEDILDLALGSIRISIRARNGELYH